jgi:hypothetical protein
MCRLPYFGERFALPHGFLLQNKKGHAMNGEPKKQEPEIMPPAPVVEPVRNVPEIPPDKDAPEKKGPVKSGGVLWS